MSCRVASSVLVGSAHTVSKIVQELDCDKGYVDAQIGNLERGAEAIFVVRLMYLERHGRQPVLDV